MSRPIKVTENMLEEIKADFVKQLLSYRANGGSFKIETKYTYEKNQYIANLIFDEMAFAKMMALVFNFDSEVAWHGIVERDGDDVFIVKDIMCYPQIASGVTVNADDQKYGLWCIEQDMAKMRLQGHSHVNMPTSPSGTDITDQDEFLEMIPDDGFYIFLIVNKKMDINAKIFDMKNNVLYERDDIDIYIGDTAFSMDEFVHEAKDMVGKKTYTYGKGWSGNYSKSGSKSNPKPATTPSYSAYNYKDYESETPYDFDDYDGYL